MADDAGKYDDFLKRTGATGTKPDYADFLARTGAVAAPEPETNTHFSDQGQNEYGITGDPQQFNQMKPGAAAGALDRIGTAAVQGYNDTAPIFTPKMQGIVDQGPVGRYITNPLMHILGAVPAGFNALGAGTTQAVNEAATAAGAPTLARDINPLIMSGTAVMGGAPGVPLTRNGLVAREMAGPVAPRFVGEAAGEVTPSDTVAAPLPQAFRENPLAPGASVPQNMLAVRPGGEAVPQSVGAAASRDMSPPGVIDMTPAEMKANRRQAEMKQILSPAEPGDTTIHVEGSLPTKAEYTGEASVSQEENLLRERSPDQFEGDKGRITANNAARVNKFEELTPSDTALQTMDRNRAAQAETDHAAIIQHATPADAQPALDVLDGVLNDKRNMNRESVQKNLSTFRARLFDEDGKLKTDPQELWGIRDDLTEKLDKIGADPQSTMGYVKKEALAFRNAIDEVLNKSTGGRYQTFLDNYAAASQEITAGNLLREFRSKLTNSAGTIQANRFHKFVTDLAEARGEKGIDPAMDIPDETMAHLIAIDTDLKRAGLIDLGKARGSPTNLLGALAQGMGLGAAHAGMAALSPGFGNLALQGAITHGTPILGKVMLNRKVRNHLAPPPGGYKPAHTD